MENHNLVSKSILVVGMLASGSVNTITKKVQNDCTANGIENQTHTFQHPWFQTAVMFSGECCCYFIFALGKAKQRKNSMKSNSFPKGTSVRNVLLFVIPTLLDILGTSFGGIGLLWVSPSIWQMMRGTIIIFSGILSAIFLKRKVTSISELIEHSRFGLNALGYHCYRHDFQSSISIDGLVCLSLQWGFWSLE